jgi:hypothetical protein
LALVGALALGVLMATPARAAAGGDPPGNNGTIKIDGRPFDDAPDNEPHPGCVFQVDFYGFDAGNLDADLTFEAVAPTAGGVLLTDTVPIGEDSHAGGGSEAGLDASKTYDLTSTLTGIEPQRNQGWHIRLTVQADGSQGSDVKHKVFWVDGCTPATAPASGDTTNDTPAVGGEDVGSASGVSSAPPDSVPATVPGTVPASVLAAELTAPAPSEGGAATAAEAATPAASTQPARVLAETETRTPVGASGANVLARTGMGLGLAVVALALVGAGLALWRVGARRLPRLRP